MHFALGKETMNVTHLWIGLSLGLKLLQSFWSYRYQIYLVLVLFLFNSQISNNARGYKIKTSWLLCSVLSPNANTSPFPIVYPPITRKTIDNFFFSNLTAFLQAMYFGGDSIKQVLFFMGAYILLISCPFVKVKTKQKSKYLKCVHPHNEIKSGDNLGRRSGPVNSKTSTSSNFQWVKYLPLSISLFFFFSKALIKLN